MNQENQEEQSNIAKGNPGKPLNTFNINQQMTLRYLRSFLNFFAILIEIYQRLSAKSIATFFCENKLKINLSFNLYLIKQKGMNDEDCIKIIISLLDSN